MLYEIISCLLCVFAVYGIYCAVREVYILILKRGGKSSSSAAEMEAVSGAESESVDNISSCTKECASCPGEYGDGNKCIRYESEESDREKEQMCDKICEDD